MADLETVASFCPVCPDSGSDIHASGRDFEYGTTGEREWTFHRCRGCRTVFLSPRPAEGELPRIYPRTYYAYDFTGKRSLGYRVKGVLDRRAARSYLRERGGAPRILDVGCGDGRLLQAFARLGVPHADLFGMELDDHAVSRARAAGFQVDQARFEDVDHAPGSFGLVVLQQVIEHMPDPIAVLRKLRRLVAGGGAIIVETPNVRSWDHALFWQRYWGGYHIPRHFYLYTPRSLRRLVTDHGFVPERMESLVSPSFWIQSVHHALANRSLTRWLGRAFDPHVPNPLVLSLFTALDLLGTPFGVTSNMRLVARKPV